jgi:hypothetical protein
MADVTIKIITAATSFDLMTLEELKTSMAIHDASLDAQLSELITRYSDVVATSCNRVFAREQVRETWRCLGSEWCPAPRVFLSHWPVKEDDILLVESPRGTIVHPGDWELEERSGKLTLFGPAVEPIAVTYTGGYDLPEQAPDALKQACELMIRAERAQQIAQATAGMRSVSHKHARVQFYDPSAVIKAQMQSTRGLGAVGDAVHSLLMHYTRIQV